MKSEEESKIAGGGHNKLLEPTQKSGIDGMIQPGGGAFGGGSKCLGQFLVITRSTEIGRSPIEQGPTFENKVHKMTLEAPVVPGKRD